MKIPIYSYIYLIEALYKFSYIFNYCAYLERKSHSRGKL